MKAKRFSVADDVMKCESANREIERRRRTTINKASERNKNESTRTDEQKKAAHRVVTDQKKIQLRKYRIELLTGIRS